MTRSFNDLFDRHPLPPDIQRQVDRIKADDQEFIDYVAKNAPADMDDDGPPWFGGTSWSVPFKDGRGQACFNLLYSREMDLNAVARSLAAGCMARQTLAMSGKMNADGTLAPVVSMVASPDGCWRVQSDLRKTICEVPAFLEACQPSIPKCDGPRAPNGKAKGKGKRSRKRARRGGPRHRDKRLNRFIDALPRGSRPKPELTKRTPPPEDHAPMLVDRSALEATIKIALRPEHVGEFDYATLEERPRGHLEAAPMFRDTDRLWRMRLKTGQQVYLPVFEETEPDWLMGLRVLTHTALTWVDAIDRGELGAEDLLPPVMPIVAYRGEDLWLSPTNIRHLDPGMGDESQIEQEYLLVDTKVAARLADTGVQFPPATVARVTTLILDEKGRLAMPPVTGVVPPVVPKPKPRKPSAPGTSPNGGRPGGR